MKSRVGAVVALLSGALMAPVMAQAAETGTSATCTISAGKPFYGNHGTVKGVVKRYNDCPKGQVTGKLIHLRWGPDEVVAFRSESVITASWTLSANGYSGDVYISKIYDPTGTSVASPEFTY